MKRNPSVYGSNKSSSSSSRSNPSVPFYHAPAPAIIPFASSFYEDEDDEGGDDGGGGGGEDEERAAAAWAARCCEPGAPDAVDEEAEAEWLARTATATAAAAAPGEAARAAERRKRRRRRRLRMLRRKKRRRAEEEKQKNNQEIYMTNTTGLLQNTGEAKRERMKKERHSEAFHREESEEEEDESEGEEDGEGGESEYDDDDEEGDEEDEEEEEEEEDHGMLYIHNVMAYAQLNCPVNLDVACQAFGNAVYMPGIFESVRVDIRCRTQCTASINIFSNGKLTGTGANSVEELRYAMKKVGRRLLLHPLTRYPVVFSHFRVKNILGSYAFPSLLSLHALAAERGLAADYEPERFPGVKVRVVVPPAVHQPHSAQQSSWGGEEGGREAREKNGKDSNRKGLGGVKGEQIGGGGGRGIGGGGGPWAASSLYGRQQQHQQEDEKKKKQVHAAAWDHSSNSSAVINPANKDEVVTIHIFSTGNVTLFGGRSIESLQYALQCVLPFLYRCRAQTE